MTRRTTTSSDDDADRVARMGTAVMAFVRDFGLLQPDRTPCGKPLTVTQAHALAQIAVQPGISQRDLGAALGLARASASELVADLHRRGWLTQTPSDTDRRQRSLQLTASGHRITNDISDARSNLMRDLLADVPADDRARIVAAVELLAATAHRYRIRTGEHVETAAS
ncbi:MAG: MarR family winged helix-turn-helix transcriptional regulator [Acidimicrobiia bacterium]